MFGHNSPLLTVSMVINTPPRKNPVKPLRTLPNIEEHNEPEPAPSASAQKQPHTGNPVIDSLIDSDSPEPPAEPKQPAAPKEAAEPALTTRSKPRSVTEELRSSVVSCDLAVEEATAKEEPRRRRVGSLRWVCLPIAWSPRVNLTLWSRIEEMTRCLRRRRVGSTRSVCLLTA